MISTSVLVMFWPRIASSRARFRFLTNGGLNPGGSGGLVKGARYPGPSGVPSGGFLTGVESTGPIRGPPATCSAVPTASTEVPCGIDPWRTTVAPPGGTVVAGTLSQNPGSMCIASLVTLSAIRCRYRRPKMLMSSCPVEPRLGTAPPIGSNSRISTVEFSFSRNAFGPVLGGVGSKSGRETRLKPVPIQVPARSVSGPKLLATSVSARPGRVLSGGALGWPGGAGGWPGGAGGWVTGISFAHEQAKFPVERQQGWPRPGPSAVPTVRRQRSP